jgi:hypothetical protein
MDILLPSQLIMKQNTLEKSISIVVGVTKYQMFAPWCSISGFWMSSVSFLLIRHFLLTILYKGLFWFTLLLLQCSINVRRPRQMQLPSLPYFLEFSTSKCSATWGLRVEWLVLQPAGTGLYLGTTIWRPYCSLILVLLHPFYSLLQQALQHVTLLHLRFCPLLQTAFPMLHSSRKSHPIHHLLTASSSKSLPIPHCLFPFCPLLQRAF